MKGTITDLFEYASLTTPRAGSITQIETTPMDVPPLLTQKISQLYSDKFDDTNTETNLNQENLTQNSPAERIYPHIFDSENESGQAREFLIMALKDAQTALESYGEADLASVNTRLSNIATAMSKAHLVTEFNESLGAVVSYLRRSMLTASAVDTSRTALNALVHVLQYLSKNPMIDLDDAAELVDKLSNEGWEGEHSFAETVTAALLDDLETDDEVSAQTTLFED